MPVKLYKDGCLVWMMYKILASTYGRPHQAGRVHAAAFLYGVACFFQLCLGAVLHRAVNSATGEKGGSKPNIGLRVLLVVLFAGVALLHQLGTGRRQWQFLYILYSHGDTRTTFNWTNWFILLALICVVFADPFIVGWVSANGYHLIFQSTTNADLLFNSVALEFIFDLDDYAVEMLQLFDMEDAFPMDETLATIDNNAPATVWLNGGGPPLLPADVPTQLHQQLNEDAEYVQRTLYEHIDYPFGNGRPPNPAACNGSALSFVCTGLNLIFTVIVSAVVLARWNLKGTAG